MGVPRLIRRLAARGRRRASIAAGGGRAGIDGAAGQRLGRHGVGTTRRVARGCSLDDVVQVLLLLLLRVVCIACSVRVIGWRRLHVVQRRVGLRPAGTSAGGRRSTPEQHAEQAVDVVGALVFLRERDTEHTDEHPAACNTQPAHAHSPMLWLAHGAG